MLNEYQRSGRTHFSNRELRLNRDIGLPPGNDSLDAPLVACAGGWPNAATRSNSNALVAVNSNCSSAATCTSSTEVTIHMEFPDEAAARRFLDDPELPVVMKASGVIGIPDIQLTDWAHTSGS